MSVALGVNFANVGTASAANASAQLGVARRFTDKVRVHLPDYQNQASIDTDVQIVQAAVILGFTKILWGVSSNRYNVASNAITQRNWPTFRQKIIDYAAIAQSLGVTHYQCGNEEELHIYAIPTSMTRASNVVTAVLPFTPDYQAGDTIYVENATPSTFNGTFTLTSNTSGTLVWSQTGTNTSATGSKVTDFLKADLRTNLRGVVSAVKAVFSGIVSTAVSQDDYIGWVNDANMGSFDFLTYNIYGENSLGTFLTQTQALLTAFPGKIMITELSLSSSWANTAVAGYTMATKGFDAAFADAMAIRVKALDNMGITEVYPFTWQNSNDDWAFRLQSGGYRAAVRIFGRTRLGYGVVDY